MIVRPDPYQERIRTLRSRLGKGPNHDAVMAGAGCFHGQARKIGLFKFESSRSRMSVVISKSNSNTRRSREASIAAMKPLRSAPMVRMKKTVINTSTAVKLQGEHYSWIGKADDQTCPG